MPMGKRYRVKGVLLESLRGPVLEVDGGGTWLLDTATSTQALIGQRVTVEGVRSSFDRLDVDWIGRTE